jgi:hypothetical protein
VDPPEDSAALLPAGWYDVYRWLRRLTPSTDAAEELTVEVCRRLRAGQPGCLANKAIDVQLRFFVAQVVLEHRGVVPARGRPAPGPQRGAC